jgi:hypothetical protein
MWVHFETFNINWLPTYVSKFPPAQALFLALGQRILRHPWYGAWISFGLMCAALCWMLQGWMPPVYAMLGTLLGMAQVGIFGYWMDSYCGGAVPAIGGCLVAGAVPRLVRTIDWRPAAIGSVGLTVLAFSRPFEGLVAAVGCGVALWWWRSSTGAGVRPLFAATLIAPFAAVCAIGAALMGYYNYRTTGHPTQMPYMVNSKLYEANPQFWLLPEQSAPVYRHEIIKNIWTIWTRDQWVRARHNPLVVLPLFLRAGRFFWRPLSGLAVAVGLLLARSQKVRMALVIVATLFAGLLMEVGLAPHYYAPAIFTLLVATMYGVRWLRIAGQRYGAALVLLFTGMAFADGLRPDTFHNWQETPRRTRAMRALLAQGGRHVVFVRYAPEHTIVMMDQVYNRADIDGSLIVWADCVGAIHGRVG